MATILVDARRQIDAIRPNICAVVSMAVFTKKVRHCRMRRVFGGRCLQLSGH